jgi:hypothetical protein
MTEEKWEALTEEERTQWRKDGTEEVEKWRKENPVATALAETLMTTSSRCPAVCPECELPSQCQRDEGHSGQHYGLPCLHKWANK